MRLDAEINPLDLSINPSSEDIQISPMRCPDSIYPSKSTELSPSHIDSQNQSINQSINQAQSISATHKPFTSITVINVPGTTAVESESPNQSDTVDWHIRPQQRSRRHERQIRIPVPPAPPLLSFPPPPGAEFTNVNVSSLCPSADGDIPVQLTRWRPNPAFDSPEQWRTRNRSRDENMPISPLDISPLCAQQHQLPVWDPMPHPRLDTPSELGVPQGKGCCVSPSPRVCTRVFIALISSLGMVCVTVGVVLGALTSQGTARLTLCLLMIGVGSVLCAVSAVAWRLSAISLVDRSQSRHRFTQHGYFPPDWFWRQPPPSYNCATRPTEPSRHSIFESPPPTYRSRADRASGPPSYRSRDQSRAASSQSLNELPPNSDVTDTHCLIRQGRIHRIQVDGPGTLTQTRSGLTVVDCSSAVPFAFALSPSPRPLNNQDYYDSTPSIHV